MSIVSRWPTVISRAAQGAISPDDLARWLVELVEEVVQASQALQTELKQRGAQAQLSDVAIQGDIRGTGKVTIAGGVTEILPESVVVSARFRPAGDDFEGHAGVSCVVSFVTKDGSALPISKAVRDDFIALAHAAAHYA